MGRFRQTGTLVLIW